MICRIHQSYDSSDMGWLYENVNFAASKASFLQNLSDSHTAQTEMIQHYQTYPFIISIVQIFRTAARFAILASSLNTIHQADLQNEGHNTAPLPPPSLRTQR